MVKIHIFAMMSRHQTLDLVVIGGGAAGFFTAINYKKKHPEKSVLILEKSNKVLSKVRVSGGGRCNLTHDCPHNSKLAKHYPRGEKFLKKVFAHFSVNETISWFENEGVSLKTEDDGRMFPITDSAQTIIDCFLRLCQKLHIKLEKNLVVNAFSRMEDTFLLSTGKGEIKCRQLMIATGGSPKAGGFEWIKTSGHTISNPVPSLFTFNIKEKSLHELAGLSVAQAEIKIEGSKLAYHGPSLITHWGLSGPAVLKLSAWGARWLAEKNYQFSIHVNWDKSFTEQYLYNHLSNYKLQHSKKKISKYPLFGLPHRLWRFLINRSIENEEKTWNDLSKKELNKLIENLYRCRFEVSGKTTFKEEFVTCGGISLSEIDPDSCQSRLVPHLYFAGEVMDIDGITGGFNFQAAWSTSYVAASNME